MKLNLKLMYIISFLQGLVFYGPISLLYRIEKGLSLSEYFFLEFILLIVIVITEVPWGYFADKYGYKKTLIMSFLIFFLGRVSLLFCNSFIGFLGQTVLTALGVSGTSGCDIAFLYKSCKEDESENVFGRYRAFNSLAFFISSLSSYFIIGVSMELAVLVTAVAYGLSMVVVCFTKDTDMETSTSKEKIDLKESFKDFSNIKWILIFVMGTALISEIAYGISVNLGQIHFKSIGIEIRYLGYISALSELLAMLSCKTHVLSKRFGQDNTLKILLSIMLLCVVILIFTNNKLVSILAICSISGLIAMASPIILDIKNKSITKNRATILSVYSMIGSLISSSGNIIIGFGADIDLKYAFIICLVIMSMGVYGVYLYIGKISCNSEVIE